MEDLKQAIANSNLIYAAMRNFPNPILQVEETANDSDKTITVTANKIWEILWIWIELTTTATVGNRNLTILVLDDSNDLIYSISLGINHAASLTRNYLFAENLPREAAFFAIDRLYHPLPKTILPAGYKIRIYDSSAVDAAADDMIIQMMVNEWDVTQEGEV